MSWQYALQNLVPFNAEVYFRLLERVNVAYWPLQLLTLAVGLLIPWLLAKGRSRLAGGLLAAIWAWVAYAFVLRYYANLNWAGHYLAAAFGLQALLVLALALTGRFQSAAPRSIYATALAITVAGLAYPLLAPLTGPGWQRAEVFGLHPDPTAVVTLGLLLMALRGWALWLAALIPLLWCLTTGVTLLVLDAPWAIGFGSVTAVSVAGMVAKTVMRSRG